MYIVYGGNIKIGQIISVVEKASQTVISAIDFCLFLLGLLPSILFSFFQDWSKPVCVSWEFNVTEGTYI